MKKYEFTREVTEYCGVTLHRIRALIDFNDVGKGELGGFIEKEENLSHSGNAWVYDNACVVGDAWVYGNAKVSDNALVSGNAWVSGSAKVADNARVYGYAKVSDSANVFDNAWVSGSAWVAGDTQVYGIARVAGDAYVDGNSRVAGDARVYGNTSLNSNADVFRTNHYLNIGPIGSRFDFTTFYRDSESGIMVSYGCFLGKLEEFKEKVRKTHGDNKHALVYLKACELAELQIGLKEI